MQDSIDDYNDAHLIYESEPELDVEPEIIIDDNIIVPNVNTNEYAIEVKKMVDVDKKQWNIHALRVCTKYLTEMSKKDFKKKRWSAIISNNVNLEKKILEQMLCNKASTLTPDKFADFYRYLYIFTFRCHLYPRKKYVD